MSDDFKIPFQRINHITIAVPKDEEAKARAFYEGVLGLEEKPQDNGLQGHYKLVWYKFLDVILHLDFTPPFPVPRKIIMLPSK